MEKESKREKCMAHRRAVVPSLMLLPCPFCGGRPEVVWTHEGTDWVKCTKCGAEVHSMCFCSPEDAAKIWNRRWNGDKMKPHVDEHTFN